MRYTALAELIATSANTELWELFKRVLGDIQNVLFSPEWGVNAFVNAPATAGKALSHPPRKGAGCNEHFCSASDTTEASKVNCM